MSPNDPVFTWLEQLESALSAHDLGLWALLFILYGAMLWLALIIWVVRDVIHRSSNVFLQIGATLLNIFFPVLGLIIYLIVRPQKTLLEKYHEDLEYRLLEGGDEFCAECGTPAKADFLFCPNCAAALRAHCTHCKKDSSRRWTICPYCGKEKGEERSKKTAVGRKPSEVSTPG